MATKKYKAYVKTPSGSKTAYIEANNGGDAQALLEGQYGKGNVSSVSSV